MRLVASILFLSLFLAGQSWAQAGRGMTIFADAIFYNGKVLTVDERFSVAQAFAVREGKIMAVGSDREILDLAGPKSQRVDLKGKTVLPGFIDTHAHLFIYAVENWSSDLESLEPQLKEFRQRELRVGSVEEGSATLKKIADQSPPDKIINIRIQPVSVAEEFGRKNWLEEMDEIAPSNPMLVRLRGGDWRANSLVFKMFTDYFGELPEDIPTDANKKPTGQINNVVVSVLTGEIVVQKPQTLAVVYKKELQAWAAHGVTTWSSFLPTAKVMSGFVLLDRAGEMPIRFAYSHQMGSAGFPQAAGFYERLGNIAGHGTDYLWTIGVALSPLDGSYPEHCTSIQAAERVKSREKCEAHAQYRIMRAAVRAGLRSPGTHAYGEGSVDKFLDIIETASAEAGLSLEEIRSKNHVIDHCGMSPRPDQIERAKKFNVIWSCAPRYIEIAEHISKEYGERYAHEWNAPIQTILRAGGRVVGETDDGGLHRRQGGIFAHIKYAVTRKDSKGIVWGPKEAVDKETALKIFTRWAAEYVMREKALGSLEPGKWADFMLIDKDYLAMPDQELSMINVLMTVVGGKPVYTEPGFAKAEGLEAVGLKWRSNP